MQRGECEPVFDARTKSWHRFAGALRAWLFVVAQQATCFVCPHERRFWPFAKMSARRGKIQAACCNNNECQAHRRQKRKPTQPMKFALLTVLTFVTVAHCVPLSHSRDRVQGLPLQTADAPNEAAVLFDEASGQFNLHFGAVDAHGAPAKVCAHPLSLF